MEKVKFTRQQYEAFWSVYVHCLTNKEMIHWYLHCTKNREADLPGIDFDTLVRALYIGYEIEETPEDRILNMYKKSIEAKANDSFEEGWKLGYKTGIKRTLQELDITIKGVNAE